MADFDLKQIAIFAQNWFRLSDPVKAERFIQKLEENEPIQELATNPLLLTLLCLVFGENADFPANRSELYKEGLDVLLKKWDAKRNIERDQLYKNLSLQRKEDLLSQIALTTFEQKDYFFKQKTVEAYIADFIRNLRDASPDPEVLRLDSEAVLKSIEAQHGLLVERAKGIYSFSHLTFQEYCAAREIVANSALENLVEHITETRWREVFLLTAGMMRNADDLLGLMKRESDRLVALDEKLQQLLMWVNQKSISVNLPYKLVAIRAFYLESARSFDVSFIQQIIPDLNCFVQRNLSSSLDDKFAQVIEHDVERIDDYERSVVYTIASEFEIELCFNWQRELKRLDAQVPNREFSSRRVYAQWWQVNGQAWTEQLRAILIKYHNIGHDWQFSKTQEELLNQYYDVNMLLIDCLNSDCYVSREVRQEIEGTLLLPMAEIEKRKQGKVG
jgi:predicted NACHT family NTPase